MLHGVHCGISEREDAMHNIGSGSIKIIKFGQRQKSIRPAVIFACGGSISSSKITNLEIDPCCMCLIKSMTKDLVV